MILLFPSLLEGIQEKKARETFAPTCHMFYPQRLVDFNGDGVVKVSKLMTARDSRELTSISTPVSIISQTY